MSRRSLHRSGRGHTVQYGPDVEKSVAHYRFDTKTFETTGDEDPKLRQFTVKTWVQIPDSEFKLLDDGISDDVLEFTEHARDSPVPMTADQTPIPEGTPALDSVGQTGGPVTPATASEEKESIKDEKDEAMLDASL